MSTSPEDQTTPGRGSEPALPGPSATPLPPVSQDPGTSASPPSSDPSVGLGQPEPGRGRPLVEGPPMSVGDPIPEGTINRAAGIGALGLGAIGTLLVLLVLLLAILGLTGHL